MGLPLTGLDEWVTRTQDPQREVRLKAKRKYQSFKQTKAVHWYEVQIARNLVTKAAYNAKLDYWEKIAAKLESYAAAGDSRALFQETQKMLNGKKKLASFTLRGGRRQINLRSQRPSKKMD